jgi:hypothetical protein
MRKTVVALALIVSPPVAKDAPLSEGPITCTSPVAADGSAKSLMQRYRQQAMVQTRNALVLWPRAMGRRIEVAFTDDAMNRVASLTIRSSVLVSRWNVRGVTIGSTLADVQNINGKPFLVNGYQWDQSGIVTNWRGGMLGQSLHGGCRIAVRFGMEGEAPKFWLGDVRLSSDNVGLLKWGSLVTETGVNFVAK